MVFLCWIFIILLTGLLTSKGEKLVLPEGQKHMIECTATDSRFVINWVDDDGIIGERFQVGDEETQNDGTRIRTISFNATAEVNNTNLRCLITDVTQTPPNVSTRINTTIFIQGTLPSLDVNSIRIKNGVEFTWSPPFSLDITDIEPDVSYYQVNVINMLDHSVTTSITYDTQYILNSSDCKLHTYLVEIAAVNVVGVGEKYTSSPIILDELSLSDVPVLSLSGEVPQITLEVETSCREIELSLTLICLSSKPPLTINRTVGHSETALALSLSDIELNEHYQLIIQHNDSYNFIHTRNLSTYDVQRVEIEEEGSEYQFKCYFAHGSRARGCMIVLRYEINGECVLNATRSERDRETVVTATLANGYYSVMVYDIEEEENEEGNPAYITTFTVINSVDTTETVCSNQLPTNENTNENYTDDNKKVIVVVICVPLVLLILLVLIAIGTAAFCGVKRRGPRKVRHLEKGSTTEEHEYLPTPRPPQQITQITVCPPVNQQQPFDLESRQSHLSLPSGEIMNVDNTTDNDVNVPSPPIEPVQEGRTLSSGSQSSLLSSPTSSNSDSSGREPSPPLSATSTTPLLPPKPLAVTPYQTHYADVVPVKPTQSPPISRDENVLYAIINLPPTQQKTANNAADSETSPTENPPQPLHGP